MSTEPYDDDDVSADLTGQFLTQADFADYPNGILFTIARVERIEFEAKNGRPAEKKRAVYFTDNRALSLNKTNLKLLAKWFGKKSSLWVGKQITVYVDESVSYAGRLTGGLRVRRPLSSDVPAFVTETDLDSEAV